MLLLLQIKLTQVQAGALFGAVLGALLGLIPLILGIIRKRTKIGVLGFLAAIIGNALLGILVSIPIIGLCVYLILKKSNPIEVRVVNENPIDVKIDSSENR